MSTVTLRAHAAISSWRPIPQLGEWPLTHVFVSTPGGLSWGCFGRDLQDEPDAKIIVEGPALLAWVREIAGGVTKQSCAGVDFKVSGICHNAANRLLIPAGVDVSDAPGNEIATPIFGKYGLGLQEFAVRVRDAAHRVNGKQRADLISEEMVVSAVDSITHSKEEEIDILREDLQEFLNINTRELSEESRGQLREIYFQLYVSRHAIYADFKGGAITPEAYKGALSRAVTEAFEDASSVLGAEAFVSLFKMPAPVAAQYVVGSQE